MESYFLSSLMTLVIDCEINVKTSFNLQMPASMKQGNVY